MSQNVEFDKIIGKFWESNSHSNQKILKQVDDPIFIAYLTHVILL